MSGRAATVSAGAERPWAPAPRTDLPFSPRVLSRKERQHRDLYVYYSPRNLRKVVVTEAINFALALRLEFDSGLEAYIERPRTLQLSPRHKIDVSFWSHDLTGRETFYLTIASEDTLPEFGGAVTARAQDELNDAAQRHGLRLKYVFERDLLRDGEYLATCFRLLPYVQSTRRILHRIPIRDGIEACLASLSPISCLQMQRALPDHDPSQVQAVAAAMVHDGRMRLVAGDGLSLNSLFEREVSHARH